MNNNRKTDSLPRTLLQGLCLALAYTLAGWFGLHWATVHGAASMVYPAAGVALAGLLLGGLRLWPAILVGSIVAPLIAPMHPTLNVIPPFAIGNTIAACSAAIFLRRTRFNRAIASHRDVLLLISASMISATVAGTIGASVLRIALPDHGPDFWEIFHHWWLGDLAGMVVLTPLFLSWATGRALCSRVDRANFAGSLVATAIITYLLFGPTASPLPLAFLVFPAVVWAAVTGGVRSASTAVFVATAIAFHGTVHRHGAFGSLQSISSHDQMALLQQFIAALAGTAMLLAVASDERRHAADRTRLATELADSEARLRAILESTPVCVKVFAADGSLEYINPAGRRMIEADPAPAPVKQLASPASPEELRRLVEARRRVLAGEQVSMQYEIITLRGNHRWFETKSVPLKTPDGEIVVLDLTQDITSRKQADDALRASEERFRGMFNAIHTPVAMCTATGEILAVNVALCELVGYEAHELIGRTYAVYTHPEDLNINQTLTAAYAEGKRPDGYNVEKRYIRKNGEVIWVRVSARPYQEPGSNERGLLAVCEDITAQRHAEQALRRSEERLGWVAEATGVGFWTWNIVDSTMTFDATAASLFAVPANTCISVEVIRTRVDTSDLDRVMPEALTLKDGGRRLDAECKLNLPDGTSRWVAGRAIVATDDAGKPNPENGIHGVVWDATARKTAELDRAMLLESERVARMEAERASRLKDDFLSTISHELRTPLNAIVGWARLLVRRPESDPELTEGLQVIDRNARAQAQLVDDLLDMGRITAGKIRLDTKPIDLCEVVTIAVSSVQLSARTKGIDIRVVHLATSLPLVGDPDRLQQVVWNLLTNAIKFTPTGGRITVTTRRSDDRVLVAVADTGQGISPEFVPQMFDPFMQADGSITRRHHGLGIGLAIVKSLVELHGGKVWAQSGGIGKGATFTLEFPAGTAGAMGRDIDPQSGSTQELHGTSVLFLDDDPDTRHIVARTLTDYGATVHTAATAEQAMDLLASAKPNVLLSDIGMPNIDGYTFIRMVRSIPADAGGKIPAIAVTAFARPEDKAQALRAGFQLHLSKPIEPMELVAAVASLATRRGQRLEMTAPVALRLN